MIITIAGAPGAGKTSLAKELAKRLGMKFYSAGDILEKIAREKNETIDELLSGDDEADHEVDGAARAVPFGNVVVDGEVDAALVGPPIVVESRHHPPAAEKVAAGLQEQR